MKPPGCVFYTIGFLLGTAGVALAFLVFGHIGGWTRSEQLSLAEVVTGMLGLAAATIALLYAGWEFEQANRPAKLRLVFAETESSTIELNHYGTPNHSLVGRFTLRLVNDSRAGATNFMAFAWFPHQPFGFQSPITYQSRRLPIPEEYWLLSDDGNEIRLQVNGRADFVCPPNSFLDLVTLSLTVNGTMAGKEWEIRAHTVAINDGPRDHRLTIRVKQQAIASRE